MKGVKARDGEKGKLPLVNGQAAWKGSPASYLSKDGLGWTEIASQEDQVQSGRYAQIRANWGWESNSPTYSLSLSARQSPHKQNGDKNTYLTVLVWGLNFGQDHACKEHTE